MQILRFIAVVLASATVAQGVVVVSPGVSVDAASKLLTLDLVLDGVPDFFTTDEYDRPADQIAVWFEEQSPDYYLGATAGSAFTLFHSGWPRVEVGSLPYALNGNVFSVTLPLTVVAEEDLDFKLILYGGGYGLIESEHLFRIDGTTVIDETIYEPAGGVPDPASAFSGLVMLGLWASRRRRRGQDLRRLMA